MHCIKSKEPGVGWGYLVQEQARADQVWGLGRGPAQQNRGQAPDQGRELGHLAAGQVLVLGQQHLERVLARGRWNW